MPEAFWSNTSGRMLINYPFLFFKLFSAQFFAQLSCPTVVLAVLYGIQLLSAVYRQPDELCHNHSFHGLCGLAFFQNDEQFYFSRAFASGITDGAGFLNFGIAI
jgi:hypothetical protein